MIDSYENKVNLFLSIHVNLRIRIMIMKIKMLTTHPSKGVAKTLKSYAHQREITGSSSVSLQVRPFSKWELLLKERICSQRERILSFKSSSLWYGKSLLPQFVTSLECYFFITHVCNCVIGAAPMQPLKLPSRKWQAKYFIA